MNIQNILINSDINYIVGILVIIFAAKLLHDKNKPGLIKNRSNIAIMIQNLFFLTAIVIISNTNIVLGGILAILYLSINL